MRVLQFSTIDLGRLRNDWDRLACGAPFRSWSWLTTWWSHFGAEMGRNAELCTLGVFNDDNQLIGIAPWYIDKSQPDCRILRQLGQGEARSEHVSVLAMPQDMIRVSDCLAEWLLPPQRSEPLRPAAVPSDEEPSMPFNPWSPRYWSHDAHHEETTGALWDCIELFGVDTNDELSRHLVYCLAERGASVADETGPSTSTISLPRSFTEYVASLDPRRRRHIQRMWTRYVETGEFLLRIAKNGHELLQGLAAIEAVKHAAGATDEYEPTPSTATCFYTEATQRLFRDGLLQLAWLERDGRPVFGACMPISGATLLMHALHTVHDSNVSSSHLGIMMIIEWAIRHGYRRLELCQGRGVDEAYWNAECGSCHSLRIAAPTSGVPVVHGLGAPNMMAPLRREEDVFASVVVR